MRVSWCGTAFAINRLRGGLSLDFVSIVPAFTQGATLGRTFTSWAIARCRNVGKGTRFRMLLTAISSDRCVGSLTVWAVSVRWLVFFEPVSPGKMGGMSTRPVRSLGSQGLWISVERAGAYRKKYHWRCFLGSVSSCWILVL